MGKLDSSMGFSINEDGSITRIGCSTRQLNTTPDFIPTSLSKLKGGFWKKVLYIIYFILTLGVHGAIVGFGCATINYHNTAEYYYREYEERTIAFRNKDLTNEDYRNYTDREYDWYTPESSYSYYERAKGRSQIYFISFIIAFVIGVVLDWKVVPRLIKNYPNKKHILKGADYVQANLGFNYGYPYIMTDNHIGVLNTHKKKVIVPPDYDYIYWIIPQNVLCAVIGDEKKFYDINGKILTNVPTSYYSAKNV